MKNWFYFHVFSAADVDTHETPSRPSKAAQQDRRIEIQPAEDEEGKLMWIHALVT